MDVERPNLGKNNEIKHLHYNHKGLLLKIMSRKRTKVYL